MFKFIILAILFMLSVAASANTTISGPITFGSGFSIVNGVVNNVPSTQGLDLSLSTSPSLLDNPGSRSNWYGGLPGQRWQLAVGSPSTPITTGGPTFSISNYYNVPITECDGFFYNTSCTSGLLVDVTGRNDNAFVTSGITVHAATTSNLFGAGVQALNVVSDGFSPATGAVQGAYIQGRRNTTTVGAVMGAEISSANYTTSTCALSYTTVGECDGIWLASRGTNNVNSHLSSALHIGAGEVYDTFWREGITFNPVSVADTSIIDKSTSTTSIKIAGTHTTAISTDAAAGVVGFGGAVTASAGLTATGAIPGIKATIAGALNSYIDIDNDDGGNQSVIRFKDAGIVKWQLGKQTTGAFFLFDQVNSVFPFSVSAAGDTTLGETGQTVNLIGSIQTSGKLLIGATSPTIASGGCTTGSAQSILAGSNTSAFPITLGGATCGSSIVLTMPAANAGWVCDAHNITNPATNVVEQSAGGSTTSVTLTNYVRTTGVAGNFTGADVIATKCLAY